MAIKASDSVTLATITDVSNYRRYYLLQASNLAAPAVPTTNPPLGSWSTTEPTYTAGATNSLYTTDLVVFSDTTFDYLPVQLSSSYEAAKVAYNKAANAEQVAGTAITSANGRNSRIYSLNNATGTVHPTTGLANVLGDTWFKLDSLATRNIIGQWGWNGSAWVAELITSAVVANLDVGKLTAGAAAFNLAVIQKLVGDAAFLNELNVAGVVRVGGTVLIGNTLLDPEVTDTISGNIDTVAESVNTLSTEVASTYATKYDLTTERSSVDSAIEVSRASILDEVGATTSALAADISDLSDFRENQDLYISLSGAGIVLGQPGSDFKVLITNTELAFLQGGQKVAYVSNNKLYITDAEVKNTMSLGVPETGYFDFETRESGNMSIKFRSS